MKRAVWIEEMRTLDSRGRGPWRPRNVIRDRADLRFYPEKRTYAEFRAVRYIPASLPSKPRGKGGGGRKGR